MSEVIDAKLFINGQWVDGGAKVREDRSPWDGSLVANVQQAAPEDLEAAIAAAQAAFPAWSKMQADAREELFLKAADHLKENLDKYNAWMMDESGSTFLKGWDEIMQSVNIWREAAGECRRIDGGVCPGDFPDQLSTWVRQPLGIVGGISPFNYPLLLALNKVAMAMAAGNCFILKPAGETPLAGQIIAECVEAAGFPAGVFNLVHGSGSVVGNALVEDTRIKMVTFTGSTEVGHSIGSGCMKNFKKCTLEMGGKNPLIVLKDFDVDRAVSIAAFGAFFHQGQICMCTSRIIVEAPIYDEFCEKFAKKAQSLKSGDPHEFGCIIGPLINGEQYKVLDGHIEDAVAKGARLLCGGTHEGNVYAASILADVTPEMVVFQEESFGPLTSVVKAEDAEDALRLCNLNEYGLSAAMLTKDLELALDMAPRIESGMIHVNDTTVMGSRRAPFGGVKASGMGREDSQFSVEEFTEVKWITYQAKPLGYPTDMPEAQK